MVAGSSWTDQYIFSAVWSCMCQLKNFQQVQVDVYLQILNTVLVRYVKKQLLKIQGPLQKNENQSKKVCVLWCQTDTKTIQNTSTCITQDTSFFRLILFDFLDFQISRIFKRILILYKNWIKYFYKNITQTLVSQTKKYVLNH